MTIEYLVVYDDGTGLDGEPSRGEWHLDLEDAREEMYEHIEDGALEAWIRKYEGDTVVTLQRVERSK